MSLYRNGYRSSVNIDLSSRDADISLSDTHKIFYLKDNIKVPDNHHVLLGLQNFALPFSWYVFRESKNEMTFKFYFTDDTTSEITIMVDDGNYTSTELKRYINGKISGQLSSLGFTSLQVLEDLKRNKFYMSGVPVSKTLDKITCTTNCYKKIGFSDYEVEEELILSDSKYYFPKCYFLCGTSVVYVKLKHKMENVNSNYKSGIIATVYNEYVPGDIIYYKPTEIQYFKYNLDDLSIDVDFLNEDYESIDTLNSAIPYHLTLTIHFAENK